MRERLSDDELDRELRCVAHDLVAQAPPAPARLPAGPVVDSLAAIPRRRLGRFLPALAAVTVVLIIVAGVVLGSGWFGSTGVDQASVTAADRRLFLESWPGELLPDGSAVPLEMGDLSPRALTGAPQALPGGRHVVVSERNPSADRATDRANYLAVLEADGGVEVERKVGSDTEWIGLLASTPTEAILIRARRGLDADSYGSNPSGQGRIVAHNLATGQERPLPIPVTADSRSSVAADAIGDRLVLAFPTGGGRCTLDVIDLTSLGWSRVAALSNCHKVRGVRVSPTGQFVAVVYGNLGPVIELRFAIVDLESGLIRDDILLGHNVLCPQSPCGGGRQVDYLGMAWENETEARIALIDLEPYDGSSESMPSYGSPIPRAAILVDTRTVR